MDLVFTSLLGLILSFFWLKLPLKRTILGLLSIIALFLGLYSGALTSLALFSLLIFALFLLIYYSGQKRELAPLAIAIAVTAWVISRQLVPGFHNWQFLNNIRFSNQSAPYSLFFNYDKAFVGIGLLLFQPALQVTALWKSFKSEWLLSLLGIFILLGLAFAFSYIRFDPKLSLWSPFWLINNLLFVCLPEEALFRGFIQNELEKRCPKLTALAITALLFGLYHMRSGPLMILFSAIAGLFYGRIYQKTGRLESSIALHFIVNSLHFFLFTYPRAAL